MFTISNFKKYEILILVINKGLILYKFILQLSVVLNAYSEIAKVKYVIFP